MTLKIEIDRSTVETILESHMRINRLWEATYCMTEIYPKAVLRPSTLLQKAACKGENNFRKPHGIVK
jgi:hypothetical protein